MDQVFYKSKGVLAIADDIQDYGKETNHDMHLHEVMERTRHPDLISVLSRPNQVISLVIFTPNRE